MKKGGSISGAVSLVMIFCVLCLAVFATLTVSTAERERKLSEMTAQNAADYYAADTKAMGVVAGLRAGKELSELDVEYTSEGFMGGTLIELNVPISEMQSLAVTLIQYAPETPGGRREVAVYGWKTVYTGDWETDDSMNIWSGD